MYYCGHCGNKFAQPGLGSGHESPNNPTHICCPACGRTPESNKDFMFDNMSPVDQPLVRKPGLFPDGKPRRTYREIFQNMTEEQLDQTPTIYTDGEYLPAEALVADVDDIVEAGQVYFKPVDEQ